jgi:hypothetical protein
LMCCQEAGNHSAGNFNLEASIAMLPLGSGSTRG